MKKFIGYITKCLVAGIISVILLSLFSLVYYNPPMAIVQPDGITNFKYIPDSSWTFMLEGVGYGKTDASGYNNAYYKDLTNPDIVFIGSSHLEALQVPQNANCVYLLNEMFDKDNLPYNNLKCYNLGLSGHFFGITASNYQYIAEKFKNAKYFVIEVSDVNFSSSMLDEMIEGKFHTPMEKKGFVYETAQKIPALRLLYKKINEGKPKKESQNAKTENGKASDEENEIKIYSEKLSVIAEKISKISFQNDIKPIVMLHESFRETKDGKIETIIEKDYKNAFVNCFENSGIKVVDLTPKMINHYKENNEFSYGFSNTSPGKGHLNKTGHRIIANVMYEYINEMEGQK